MYVIEGAAKSLACLGKSIGHLSQQATHHCCDGEVPVRTPHHLIQQIAVPEAEAIELSLISNSGVSVTQKLRGELDSGNSLSKGLGRE